MGIPLFEAMVLSIQFMCFVAKIDLLVSEALLSRPNALFFHKYRLYCVSMEIHNLDGTRGPELYLSERSEDATKGSEAVYIVYFH